MTKVTDYTLAGITELKANWLLEGQSLFDRFATVAREMGELVVTGNREYMILSTRDVTVQLVERTGPWNPATGKYHQIRHIYVTQGKLLGETERKKMLVIRENHVAYLDASTMAPELQRINPAALFYRPGEWCKKVLALEPMAIERQKVRAIQADNAMRDTIYFQLQLDKEV